MKKLPETKGFKISKKLLSRIRRIVLMKQFDGGKITIREWIEDAIQQKLPKIEDFK